MKKEITKRVSGKIRKNRNLLEVGIKGITESEMQAEQSLHSALIWSLYKFNKMLQEAEESASITQNPEITKYKLGIAGVQKDIVTGYISMAINHRYDASRDKCEEILIRKGVK